jgi:error-prone DNA polymerase
MTGLPELHTRSAFSFLEGASLPEDLIARAAELDIPAVALLDRDGIYGAPRFYMAAKKAGVRAHVGAEITLAPDKNGTQPPRLSVLVENRAGYHNLCQWITRMKLGAEKGKAAASWNDIAEFHEGLVCLTRTPSQKLIDVFGSGNVYGELQRHFQRDEEAANLPLIESGLPLIATNGATYARAERRELADMLTCVRHKRTIETAGQLLERNAERHLKPARDMQRLFADVPRALDGARELSARLGFTLADLGYEFPRYPTPGGESMDAFLRDRTMAGARNRYRPLGERASRQLERELDLIAKLGLAGYFLIVWDIVEFCRRENVLVQGRGSAANSAVCYSLGITAVDPVGMDLLFERFLSEERSEWPDIDLDLPSGDKRERVIQYVYERYGKHGAAMTANVITYRGRSALRDAGKALGFTEQELGRISPLLSHWGGDGETAGERIRQAGFDTADRRVGQLVRFTAELQELPRHLGQHSGGMVISQGALSRVVPLEPATMPGRVVVEWDKDDCANMGIIKVDLLGLGMMAVLEDTIELISGSYGERVDLAHLPPDDPQVYSALQQADTIGVFQVESRAQMSCLPRLKPRNFYDLVVEVAIIRPGPIVGNMVHPYLRRRAGEEPVDYMHPSLEPVLKRTLGVPLFQEQLIRMAMTVADFTGGEAEELRRVFGFKRSEQKIPEIEKKLRAGMAARGITQDAQDRIVQAITSFALYGFPESHAASFALLSYASAWLRCRYPAAFMAAMLNNQPMGFYHPQTLVKDAQRHGLRFRPVDVARSDWRCAIERDGAERQVRLGFNYLRGFRRATAEALVKARGKRHFANIQDLVHRVPQMSKSELHALADCGALNSLEPAGRRQAMWQSASALRPVGELLRELTLDGDGSTPGPLQPMSPFERLEADFRNTGMSLGRHPVGYFRNWLDGAGILTSVQTKAARDGSIVSVAGSVICRQQPMTAKGFVFLSLEDETGIANIIVSPQLFEAARVVIVRSPYLVVDGILQNQSGVIHVKAGRVRPLALGGARESVEVASKDFC